MATDVSTLTVSFPTVVQALYTVALAGVGAIAWFLKGMLDKLEKRQDALEEDNEKLRKEIQDAENRARADREASCREVNRAIEKVRDECAKCVELRRREYTDCVDTYGKFGARLSTLEGAHNAQLKTHGGC